MRPRPARRPKASCCVTSVPYRPRRGRPSGQRSGRIRSARPRCGGSACTAMPTSPISRPAGLRSPTRPDAASAATGLNLQFCHLVVNYDIPWNPMRLEQRIGRVDRIGQESLVRAFNFALDGTVEHRVRAVLEEKLGRILQEFGVDKAGDVLDSADAEALFDDLYVEA